MRIKKSIVHQVANGETVLTGEAVMIARRIISENLLSKFMSYVFLYNGDGKNIGDIQDCILDFSCNGVEAIMPVDKKVHPFGRLRAGGITVSAALERLDEWINSLPFPVSNKLEGAIFTITGIEGKYSYVSTYFHYHFGEGAITEKDLLTMIKVA